MKLEAFALVHRGYEGKDNDPKSEIEYALPNVPLLGKGVLVPDTPLQLGRRYICPTFLALFRATPMRLVPEFVQYRQQQQIITCHFARKFEINVTDKQFEFLIQMQNCLHVACRAKEKLSAPQNMLIFPLLQTTLNMCTEFEQAYSADEFAQEFHLDVLQQYFSSLGQSIIDGALMWLIQLAYCFKIVHHVDQVYKHYDLLEEFERKQNLSFTNKTLLRQAFTHPTYANQLETKSCSNYRLEFLGDSIVQIAFTHYIAEQLDYHKPNANIYSMLQKLIANKNLNKIGASLQLHEYLLTVGILKDSIVSQQQRKILADTLEALVGAIFLDKGLEQAIQFVLRTCLPKEQSFVEFFGLDGTVAPKRAEYVLSVQELELLNELEELLGYTFNDKTLLLASCTYFTWQPAATRHPLPDYLFKSKDPSLTEKFSGDWYEFNMERTRFWGHTWLKFFATELVFRCFPEAPEEKMTLSVHSIMNKCQVCMKGAINELQIEKFVRFGDESNKYLVCSAAVVAIFGAVYLDSKWSGKQYLTDKLINMEHMTGCGVTCMDLGPSLVHNHYIKFFLQTPELYPSHHEQPLKHQLSHLVQVLYKQVPKFITEKKDGSEDIFISKVIVNDDLCLAMKESSSYSAAEAEAIEEAVQFCRKLWMLLPK